VLERELSLQSINENIEIKEEELKESWNMLKKVGTLIWVIRRLERWQMP